LDAAHDAARAVFILERTDIHHVFPVRKGVANAYKHLPRGTLPIPDELIAKSARVYPIRLPRDWVVVWCAPRAVHRVR
jgi:hypothetical protein